MLVKPVVKLAFVADCHFTTVPVFPDKPKVVELVPVHTVDDPEVTEIVPATDVGSTVIVKAALVSFEQTPDATIGRWDVVGVMVVVTGLVVVIDQLVKPVVK